MSDERDHIEEMAEHKRERTQQLEESLREELGSMSYPVETSDVQAAYADGRIDVPNETEALAVAFDRLTDDETYETEQEVREELLGEITGEAGREQGDLNEYNPERELQEIDEQERAGVGDGVSDEETSEPGSSGMGSSEVVDRQADEREAGARGPDEREGYDEAEWVEGHEEDLVEEGERDRVKGERNRAEGGDRMESDEQEDEGQRASDDHEGMESDEPE